MRKLNVPQCGIICGFKHGRNFFGHAHKAQIRRMNAVNSTAVAVPAGKQVSSVDEINVFIAVAFCIKISALYNGKPRRGFGRSAF